jgi:hypothetical protein
MNGGEKRYGQRIVATTPVAAAVTDACSGDVIQLVGDDYQFKGKGLAIRRDANDPLQKPIIIRGLGAKTTIKGGTKPGYKVSPRSMRPEGREAACLRIKDQFSIVIERINFEDCWPIAIHAINSSYITLRDSRITGSTFGFYAQGLCRYSEGECRSPDYGETAHHYLIENVQWIQDPPDGLLPPHGAMIPSGEMWRRYRWTDVHDPGRPYHFFNGALFGSWNILGGVVFRSNQIHNAFNGIRLNAPRQGAIGTRNLNVEVYDNLFSYIRDNSVEPERQITNLWVHGNRSDNVYASLSIDGVGGNYWYVFGNVHWFNEAPNRECELDPLCRACLEQPQCAEEHLHRRGKTLKPGEGPFPGEAFYIFQNSAYQSHPYAADGETRNVHVLNNAIEGCRPDDHPEGECSPIRAFDSFCYHETYRFDGNITNDRGYMKPCSRLGEPPIFAFKNVYDPASTPFFKDPLGGDLRLAPNSPAKGTASAIRLTLPDGTTWSNVIGETLMSSDVGAYDGDMLFSGPPFVHFDPEDQRLAAAYRERPRIVRLSREEDSHQWTQRITFSVPIYFDGTANEFVLEVKVDNPSGAAAFVSERCNIEGARLSCTFPRIGPMPSPDRRFLMLPRGIRSKERRDLDETADIEMTLWASVDPRVCFQPKDCPKFRLID